MAILNPAYAPSVPFRRPNTDADGNKAPTALGLTPVVVSEKTKQVFVPRGLDRKSGDQFEFNGGKYTLSGRARGDMLHPFTGDDFGWMAFDIEEGWTPMARGVK